MNRCFLSLLAVAAVLLSALGWFWIQAPPSNQELLANTAKALDYAAGWKSVGGPVWWTPNFLNGTSLATSLTSLLSSIWLLIGTSFFGIYAGPKIASLGALFIGAAGMYLLGNRLTKNPWIGLAAALLFLLSPPVYFRLVHVEHMVFVSAFAVIPFVILRLTIFIEEPTRQNGMVAGALFALLLITYAKAAALLFPLLVPFGIVLWIWTHRTWRIPFPGTAVMLAAILILGVLPNLPGIREMQFAAVFELAPFEGWKSTFSLKNGLVWFDRDGILTTGVPPTFAPNTAQGASYSGFATLLLLGAVLALRPSGLYSSKTGVICRLFLALALLSTWFSFGPHSVIGGQLAFLKDAFHAPDPVIAFSWLILILQGWLIMGLLPPSMPGRRWICAVTITGYLLVPGFRLISWLPVYKDFRAPHDFFQIGGMFFLSLAAACAIAILIVRIAPGIVRVAAACALAALAILDLSPFLQPFYQSPLERSVFDDFSGAEQFLAKAPKEGWVFPLSGRYFYLLTPHLANRGLATEAFTSYLMQRGTAYLQAAAQQNPPALRSYLNLGGVAYVLIDQKDPDVSEETITLFRSVLPVAYENERFLILENQNAFAPAALVQNYVSGEAPPARIAHSSLSLEKMGAIVLPFAPSTFETQRGKIGTLTEKGHTLENRPPDAASGKVEKLKLTSPRTSNFHRISVAAPGGKGWLYIPESYHPDWTAKAGDKVLPVLRADGAFIAVPINEPDKPVTLTFEPPWWYNGVLAVSAVSWAGFLVLIALSKWNFLPPGLRQWLAQTGLWETSAPVPQIYDRAPIERPLVIIPTYNEKQTLSDILRLVLGVDARLKVLIVDDNSPDGTAEIVKNHPEYEKRIHLLTRRGKLGLGSAYKEGFQWAMARNFDACLEMDADLSHNPNDITRLLKALDEGADAAIGSRYLGGVRVMNWSENRLFLSTGASRFVRFITGLPLTDATSGFKALRCSALKTLDWNLLRAEGYGFQVELHYFLWQAGARLVEVPIVFTERRDGETKMTPGIALEAAWLTLRLSTKGR